MHKPQHKLTLEKARALVAPFGWHLDMPGDELVAKVRHLPIPDIERIMSAVTTIYNHEIEQCRVMRARAEAMRRG